MKIHKRNNRFYNNESERVRHRIFNVAQVAWHVLVKKMMANRPAFVPKDFDASRWVEPMDCSQEFVSPSVTWLGHATSLLMVEGLAILTDPIEGDIGTWFKRAMAAPTKFADMPFVDVILLSHNHRDHLDIPTLSRLKDKNPLVLVPQGDAELLRQLGFHRVHEFSWHEPMILETNTLSPKKVEIVFLPAIHWSGRGVLDANKSLWGSWLIKTPDVSIYFAGDSAYGKHFFDIAHRYGPPDVVLMPIGPEEPRHLMAQSHVGVEEALQAFDDLSATHFIPIHWGAYGFGVDQFIDPIEKLRAKWDAPQREFKRLHLMPMGRTVVLDKL